MNEGTAERLASTILEQNKHLVEFEVDPMDEEAAALVSRALAAYGCDVRSMTRTRLLVVCPPDIRRNGSKEAPNDTTPSREIVTADTIE